MVSRRATTAVDAAPLTSRRRPDQDGEESSRFRRLKLQRLTEGRDLAGLKMCGMYPQALDAVSRRTVSWMSISSDRLQPQCVSLPRIGIADFLIRANRNGDNESCRRPILISATPKTVPGSGQRSISHTLSAIGRGRHRARSIRIFEFPASQSNDCRKPLRRRTSWRTGFPALPNEHRRLQDHRWRSPVRPESSSSGSQRNRSWVSAIPGN